MNETWTRFMDMHSGGGLKLDWNRIYIEAPKEEAEIIFQNKFDRNPNRVTCTCCGEDYSIGETKKNFAQASGYDRGCRNLVTPQDKNGLYMNDDPIIQNSYYLEDGELPPKGYEVAEDKYKFNKYQTVEEYKSRDDVLIVPKSKISEEERKGELREEGYVWAD